MLQVLYIDDEPDLLFLCKNYLEDTGEFSVDIVPSTSAGIAKLKEKSYDAVISDYQMRGLDGLSLLKSLRSGGSSVPFILFTGRGREEVAIEALNSGADYYLQKGGEPESQFAELSHKIHLSVEKRKIEESLREKNEYLTSLIRYASNLIVIWDADFHITQVNQAFEKLTGFSESEVLGKDLDLLFPTTTRANAIDLTARTLFGEKWESVEIPLKTKSGEERIILWNSANIYARDGKTPISTIAQGTDITEMKDAETRLKDAYEDLTQSEEELRQNYDALAALQKDLGEREEKYRSLFTYMSEGVVLHEIVYDGNGEPVDYRILDANPATLMNLGIEPGNVIGKLSRDAWGGDEPPYFATYLNVVQTGVPVSFETYFPPLDRYFFISAYSPRKDQFATVFLDITPERKAQDALKESEEKFRSLFLKMAQGVVYMDQTGKIIDVNPAAEKILGRSREGLLSLSSSDSVWKAIHEDGSDYPGARHPAILSLRTGREAKGIMGVYNPRDHMTHWILIDAIPIFRKENEKPVQVFTTFNDITEIKKAEGTIRTQGKLLRLTGEMAKVGGWEYDPVTKQTTWTDEVIRIHDLDKSGVVSVDTGFELYKEQDRTKVRKALKELVEKGTLFDLDLEMTTRKGVHKWIRAKAQPEFHEGKVTLVRGTFQDISDLKNVEIEVRDKARKLGDAYERLAATEEELREQYENLEKSQQEYREQSEFLNTLIETIPTPVYYKDTEGRFIGCNQEMEQILGVSREKILGKTVFDVVEKEEAEIHAESDKEIYYHNLPVQYQMHIGGIPGRDVIFYKAPFRSASGTVGGLIGVILDISGQKRVENALRENETRLALALNSARMGVWQWDIVTNHRTFAPETCYLLGIDPEQFRGTPEDFFSHVHPDDREILYSAMKRTLEEDVLYEPEYRVIWPDGSLHFLTARGQVVRDNDGKPLLVNGLLWDITSRKELEAKVHESEENYRRIVDTAEEGIWQMDRDFVISYVNPKVSSLLGYTEDEIIGKPMSRFLLQEDLLDHALHMEKRRAGLGDFYERRFMRKDGKVVWMQVSASVILDPEGNFSGSFAMLNDITQRKAVEEELRESETRFRAIIQNATDIIRILDRDGIILYDSPSSEKLLGYPHGFTIGKNPFEFIHPEDEERVRSSLHEVYEKKNPGLPTEFRIRKSDGSYLYVESVGVNLLGVSGVDGIVVTTHPIDERKKVEQALRKNQIQLANAMDLSHLVNWEYDLSTNLFFFDDRFYALYGTTTEREGGNYLNPEEYAKRFVHPDDLHIVEEAVRGLESVTDPQYFCQTGHRIVRRDGVIRYISVRFAVVIGESGKVVKTYGANQDVTEWRDAEEQLKHFNEDLEAKILLRTRELEHSLKERTILVQEIHHRVKNNLQIIVSLIRLQQRQLSDLPAKNALLDSESRVRSMALVHEKLYRSEDVTHINLTDYVRSLVLSVSNMYRADPHRVKIISSLETITLDIHRAIPLGLLMNELITNSFKYAFPDGRSGEIRISGTAFDGQIAIIIHDNGIGIPKDVDWKTGTTLGLHLVNTLVEQLRGTITHDPGIPGTHFEITIPIEELRGKTE